jgi:hypothetical protein
MSDPRKDDRRGERGSVMVIAALALVALVLFAALAIDLGFVWSSRTQSQNAADSAALAAAKAMIKEEPSGKLTVALDDAVDQGTTFAGDNSTVGNPSVTVEAGDFEFGNWDLETRKLVTDPPDYDPTNPDLVTGVRVKVAMDNAENKRSPTFLAQLLGRSGFEVKNTATAYLGFEGDFKKGEFCMPIAISDLPVNGGKCNGDYCEAVSSPPNPCQLFWKQGQTKVTCLDWSSTGVQNACWTQFDATSSQISTNGLEDIVDLCNPTDLEAGDPAFLDNGDKDAALQYIRDKFYGFDKFKGKAAGEDRYKPNPAGSPDYAPQIDSWVVKLPVFESQAGAHCSGGVPFKINGGLCFQIREILAPGPPKQYGSAERVIKGKFLCPHSGNSDEQELYDKYCAPAEGEVVETGGCNGGLRANKVVLVE